MKFEVDVCVFNQENDIKNNKMKFRTIHTSDYLRLYGYNKKKVENLQLSDRKIYLLYHTQSHPVNGFRASNNHYAYLQLQNEILPKLLDYDTGFTNDETEMYLVEAK